MQVPLQSRRPAAHTQLPLLQVWPTAHGGVQVLAPLLPAVAGAPPPELLPAVACVPALPLLPATLAAVPALALLPALLAGVS